MTNIIVAVAVVVVAYGLLHWYVTRQGGVNAERARELEKAAKEHTENLRERAKGRMKAAGTVTKGTTSESTESLVDKLRKERR